MEVIIYELKKLRLIMVKLERVMQTVTSSLAGVFLFLLLYYCGKYLNEQRIVPNTFTEVKEFFFLLSSSFPWNGNRPFHRKILEEE